MSGRFSILGSLLLALLLSAVAAFQLREVIQHWHSVMPPLTLFLVPSVIVYLFGHTLRGERCRSLVSEETTLSKGAATNVVVVGYAVNNLLPFRMGEFFRAFALSEQSGLPYLQSLVVIVIERLFDVLALLILGILASAQAGISLSKLLPLGIIEGFSLLGMLFLFLGMYFPSLLLSPIQRTKTKGDSHGSYLMVRAIQYLKKPRQLFKVFFLSLLIWCCDGFFFFFLDQAFEQMLSISDGVLIASITNLGLLWSWTAGHVGLFHTYASLAANALGMSVDGASGYAFLAHFLVYFLLSTWGILILAFSAFGMLRDADLKRGGRAVARVQAPTQASSLIAALCEALIPPQKQESPEKRQRQVAEVSLFVEEEIAELPDSIRLVYRLGLLFFSGVTYLRFQKTPEKLEKSELRDWANAWAYGPIPLTRKLFRPLRSMSLLAYFELPDIQIEEAHG